MTRLQPVHLRYEAETLRHRPCLVFAEIEGIKGRGQLGAQVVDEIVALPGLLVVVAEARDAARPKLSFAPLAVADRASHLAIQLLIGSARGTTGEGGEIEPKGEVISEVAKLSS